MLGVATAITDLRGGPGTDAKKSLACGSMLRLPTRFSSFPCLDLGGARPFHGRRREHFHVISKSYSDCVERVWEKEHISSIIASVKRRYSLGCH
jgi:hypothetical protein